MRKIIASILMLSFAWFGCGALQAAPPPPVKAETPPPKPPKEKEVITHHQLAIDGRTIPYTALAGTLTLKDKEEKPTATVFFIAYTLDGESPDSRPITFTYNGGPGSSSVWLHLGGVGPRRLETHDPESNPGPPYKVSNNPYSILDKTDLVYIDPVGTGFSHVVGKTNPKKFWSVDGDVDSVGQFIQRYITKFNRWNSPKFILGESYGTTRSAALAYYLQEQGIQLNGVILVSSILNFETAAFSKGNDLPYVLYLPSYSAVAWYHHKLSPAYKDLQSLLEEVKRYAVGPYASALMKGDLLDKETESSVAQKLSSYTGVSASFWKKTRLRVDGSEFEKVLLEKEGKMTGRLDARYTGYAPEEVFPFRDYAVMSEAVGGAFTAAINSYLANDLNYKSSRPYVILSGEVNKNWEFKHEPPGNLFESWPGFLDVSPDLAMAMITNPHLQVMVNNGYFDLGTPFFATDYTFNHLQLPSPLRSHLHEYNYMSGHMIYLHTPSLKELHENIDHFISSAL